MKEPTIPTIAVNEIFDEVHPQLPEHNLLLAIIERAALDCAGPAITQRHVRRSAEQFFNSVDDCEWSFIWMCDHLSIDADYFRDRILKGIKIALNAKQLGIKIVLCQPINDE